MWQRHLLSFSPRHTATGGKRRRPDSERPERDGLCWLLKLRWMGTQGVQMKGVLPWLVGWLSFTCRNKRFLFCLGCFSRTSTEYMDRQACWVACLLVCVSLGRLDLFASAWHHYKSLGLIIHRHRYICIFMLFWFNFFKGAQSLTKQISTFFALMVFKRFLKTSIKVFACFYEITH